MALGCLIQFVHICEKYTHIVKAYDVHENRYQTTEEFFIFYKVNAPVLSCSKNIIKPLFKDYEGKFKKKSLNPVVS